MRALVEVVRQGGFSQAAKTIHATQPTVSKAIKQLEDELGMPLLDRQVYPPRLTEAGEIVYRRALSMLAERDDLRAELDALRGRSAACCAWACPAGAARCSRPCSRAFAAVIRASKSAWWNTAAGGEEMVMAGEIELAATLRPVPDNFDWQPVAREPLIALMPADHPRAGAAVGLVELRDTPFILFETGFALNRIIQDACQRAGFTPTVAAREQADRLHRRPGRRRPGRGLPAIKADEETHAGVSRVPCDPGTDWEMVQVWRRGGYLSHAAQAWLALTRDPRPTTT